MIFKPVLIAKILAGEKTVTRRPVNGDKPCAYRVGQEYSIQPGMARPSVARIRVLSVHRQELGDLGGDDDEAQREGFARWEDFFDYWRTLYGRAVIPWDLPVWRIKFELVERVADVCICCDGKGVTDLGTVRLARPEEFAHVG